MNTDDPSGAVVVSSGVTEGRMDRIQRERAAQEKRCWVRLTRACNNHCLFCLDSDVHDGTMVPPHLVKEQIERGRAEGAERLILSGGEPTIHKNYLEFVEFGRKLGYGWIQTITNGRMFAYPRFAERAAAAGLREATFSMHGHTPRLHDRLVGVAGAFSQSMQGLKNLMQLGIVVNVDIVLNRDNLPHLDRIIEHFLERGVGEFDLLWPVPFGRAWRNRERMLWPKDARSEQLLRAIELARDRGAVVWTNRLPPQLLEGLEEFIQDPYKLHDEVRGRREQFEQWLSGGQPPFCRTQQRCRFCFMEQFCGEVEKMLPLLSEPAPPSACTTAASCEKAARSGGPVRIALNKETAAWIEKNVAMIRSRPNDFTFLPDNYLTLAEYEQKGLNPLDALRPLHGSSVKLEGLPACLLPDAEPTEEPARWWTHDRPAGHLDDLVDDFVLRRYRVRSLRCRGCRFEDSCPGLSINMVRMYGFALANPLGFDPPPELCDTAKGPGLHASVVVRSRCSNACSFCTTRLIAADNRAPWPIDPWSAVRNTIEQLAGQGYRILRFAAIEPLEHPDILRAIRHARKLGFERIEIWTHAGPCRDEEFARKLVEAGLSAIDVPVMGPGAEVHDAVAGRLGAWQESLAGVGNLRSAGLSDVSAHMVIARGNHRHVVQTYAACCENEFGPLQSLVLAAPSLSAATSYEPVAVPLEECAEAIGRDLGLLSVAERGRFVGLASRCIPHCVLLRHIDRQMERHFATAAAPGDGDDSVEVKQFRKSLTEQGEKTRGFDLKRRSRCPRWADCSRGGDCPGIYPLYLELYGDGEFQPL